MSRPNEGITSQSIIFTIRINKKFIEEFKERAYNLRQEILIRDDKQQLLGSNVADWQVRKVYTPRKKV